MPNLPHDTDADLSAPDSYLDLTPGDLAIATWREPPPPAPLVAPLPFDWDAVRAQFDRIRRRQDWLWRRRSWDLPAAMAPRTARFWLEILLRTGYQDYQVAKREINALLKAGPAALDDGLTAADFHARFGAINAFRVNWQILLPARALFGATALLPVATATEYLTRAFRDLIRPTLTTAERAALRDHLAADSGVNPFPTLGQGGGRFNARAGWWAMAAYVGLSAPIADGVAAWPDDAFGAQPARSKDLDSDGLWFDILLGLGDPALVVHHFQRLKLPLRARYHVSGWLAHTGLDALDFVAESIRSHARATGAAAMTEAFGRAYSAETARHMFHLSQQSRAPRQARAWLEAHPAYAAAGVASLAAGSGPAAESARYFLAELVERGAGDLVDRVVDPATRAWLAGGTWDEHTDDTLPTALAAALAPWPATALGWIDATRLPPLVVGARQLSAEQVHRLLHALSAESADDNLLLTVRESAEPAALDAFIWRLLALWQSSGAGLGQRWVFEAVGRLGSDDLALRLHRRLRRWAEEKRPAKWIDAGLDALLRQGSDLALLQLYDLTLSFPRRSLRDRAEAALDRAAAGRGLSRAALGDRIVPTGGLDDDGTQVFDYGSRRFTAEIGPDLKPRLRSAEGKTLRRLPAPRQSDDPAAVAAARDQWRALRRTLQRLIKVQSARLELALAEERRWTWAEFERFFLAHPLLRHLARHLVWGVWTVEMETVTVETPVEREILVQVPLNLPAENDNELTRRRIASWWRRGGGGRSGDRGGGRPRAGGTPPYRTERRTVTQIETRTEAREVVRLTATFRVAEDFSLADMHDEPIALPPAGWVGLVHPLHLSAASRAAWQQLLHDYELVAPFAQLDRPRHELSPAASAADTVVDLQSVSFRYIGFSAALRRRGWRDYVNPGPWNTPVVGHVRRFETAGVTAVVLLAKPDGAQPVDHATPMRLKAVYFTPSTPDQLAEAYRAAIRSFGRRATTRRPRLTDVPPPAVTRLRLDQVSPVAVSEVIHDLLSLSRV